MREIICVGSAWAERVAKLKHDREYAVLTSWSITKLRPAMVEGKGNGSGGGGVLGGVITLGGPQNVWKIKIIQTMKHVYINMLTMFDDNPVYLKYKSCT